VKYKSILHEILGIVQKLVNLETFDFDGTRWGNFSLGYVKDFRFRIGKNSQIYEKIEMVQCLIDHRQIICVSAH